jgi:transposase
MEEDGLHLTAKDARRIDILIRVEAGLASASEAGALLGVSERQVRRLLARYRTEGAQSVVHGNRGRRPKHAVAEGVKAKVLELATDRYKGVNHTHMAELLREHEGIEIARSTLADLLREAGLRSPRPQKRRSLHRSRRERYPQEGMLWQTDGSHHDWLEGRGPRMVLLAVIDDATSNVPGARFEETEDAAGYMRLMRDVCHKVGVPQALYSDKHSIFWPTNGESLAEQLAGRRSPTQFGRAMAELGIQLIPAHSPQAKGRVERLWGTLQDRLVSELRLAGVTNREDANAFLPGFFKRFHRSFSVAPAELGSAYRPRLTLTKLDTILCFKHERVVAKDNCVKVGQIVLQVLPGPNRIGYAHATVTIHESLEATYAVFFQGRHLPSKLVPLRRYLTPKPKPHTPADDKPAPPSQAPLPWKPAPDHPWRRSGARTKSPGT